MKIITIFASMFLAGAMGASSSASAATEGVLDNTWFNTRLKTNFKKDHGLVQTGSSLRFNGSPIQFDSGKDACFSVLNWQGAGSHAYKLTLICEGTGGWEVDGEANLIELDDGSVGFYLTQLAFPEDGQSLYPSFNHGVAYFGAMYLKTSLRSDGTVKNVKLLQPVDGYSIYIDQGTSTTIGTSAPGLKMKRVNPGQVPDGAQGCLASFLGTGPALPNC